MSKLIRTDLVYKEWIQDVSRRFRRSQLKAAVKVNDEMLRFYWSLGQDISRMNKDARYGTEFYKTISRDLKDIFPDVHSFSPTNLKYMRYFYEMYPDVTNRQQLVDDFKTAENRQQAADELELPEKFAFVPLYHHVEIITKCQSLEEALFYITKCIENNWSREQLGDEIKANLLVQLTAPVRWTQSVQNMVADGATEFVELGPGKVLQGLVSKISREVAVSGKQ